MPSADSRCTVRMNRSTLSHDSVTCCGAPEVSSTAFRAQPPDLPPVQLVDMGFAVVCQLAPHRRPLHPVLVHRLARLIHASFRPRLATTPLRFSSLSPPPGWAGDFHPQAVEHVRHTNQKPPIRIGGSEKPRVMDAPPLHDRTFPRTLPHKCGWRRVAIGMGLAHHCLELIFTVTSFLKFVNTQKWWAGRESNPDLQLRTLPCCSVTLPTHLELAPGIQPGSHR